MMDNSQKKITLNTIEIKTSLRSPNNEEKQKSHRQNIFSSSKQNITAEFFGTDVAGYIKMEFIR
jgi:hypothetical protein